MQLKCLHSIEPWLSQLGHQAGQNPFCHPAFLLALEQSGACQAQSGWQPAHIGLFEADQLVALVPSYLKSHSWGEYVFDQGWAEAYQRHGMHYYPKLLSAIPFTPSLGPRMLVLDAKYDEASLWPGLLDALPALLESLECQNWHGLFVDTPISHSQLSYRQDVQFHWFNRGYHHFDDFLATFKSRKRKTVVKERQKAHRHGLTLTRFTGTTLSKELLAQFYHCYQATYLKRGRQGYLPQDFFERLLPELGEQMMLVAAMDQNQLVAASLFFFDDQRLYGRYWGCLEELDCLHFECCYYQGIEFAIERGLSRFDPGTQGEHKIPRGFEPISTQSLHYISHPEFRRAIEEFCQVEAEQVAHYQQQARALLPFKETT